MKVLQEGVEPMGLGLGCDCGCAQVGCPQIGCPSINPGCENCNGTS